MKEAPKDAPKADQAKTEDVKPVVTEKTVVKPAEVKPVETKQVESDAPVKAQMKAVSNDKPVDLKADA